MNTLAGPPEPPAGAQPDERNLSSTTSWPEPHRLVTGSCLAGRYRLCERIGSGGMGIVFRAHDDQLEVDVAIKVLRPDLVDNAEILERFRREVLLARQVSHPNVVRIHDLIVDGNTPFLSMDYIAGWSLRERLAKEGRLELGEALTLGRQIAEGLAAAHRRNVIHRDLKPANILLDKNGQAYITDFGIATSTATSSLTEPGQLLGTPDYITPEQAVGEPADYRSDIFAFGLLLFEMLSGTLPFRQRRMPEVLIERARGQFLDLSEVGIEAPRFVREVLQRCLARDPDARYQSADEVVRDLSAGSTKHPPARPLLSKGNPGTGLAFAIVLVVVAAGLLWLSLPSKPGNKASKISPTPATTVDEPQQLSRHGSAVQDPPRHAVAVLPLADQTGRPDLAWVSTGIAEGLTTALAESPELCVIDSLRTLSAVTDLKLSTDLILDSDLRLLAEVLDADRLVYGRVRDMGGRLQVELELVAVDLPQLPTQRLTAEGDRESEFFELLRQLGSQLRQELVSQASGPTPIALSQMPTALAAYRQGLGLLAQGDSMAALPHLETAVTQDPAFLAAWIHLVTARVRVGQREQALSASAQAVSLLAGRGRDRLSYLALAQQAQLERDLLRAQQILQQLTAAYPHDLEARIALSEALGAEGRFKEAIAALQEVVTRDPNHPRAWLLLGRYAILEGDSRRASDEYLVRAQVIQNRLGNRIGQAEVLNALGAAYDKQGDLTQAGDYYRRAAELLRASGEQRGYAALLSNLASIYRRQGDFQAAREHLSQALALRRALDDNVGIAQLENRLGELAENQGLYLDALAHYRQALALRRELGDRGALAESHKNIGFVYFLLGEPDNAAAYFEQALALYRELGNREGIVAVALSLTQLELSRGHLERAAELGLEALRLGRELGRRDAEAVSLALLGRLARYRGRLKAALDALSEARAIFTALNDQHSLVEVALLEASARLEFGDLETASQQLREARAGLAVADDRQQRAELRRLEGMVALSSGEPAKARQAFDEAQDLAAASGAESIRQWAQLGLGWIALENRDTSTAERLFREVSTAAGPLGNVPLGLHAAIALSTLAMQQGDLTAAETAARRGLALAQARPFAAAYRLHAILAEALAARGQLPAAQLEWQQAAALVAEIRAGLAQPERQAFDQLPEVLLIDQARPPVSAGN